MAIPDFIAGQDIADIFTTMVGPVEAKPDIFGFSELAIPDFIARLVYGFTGDNQLERIEGCFDGSVGIYINVREGIDNIESTGANWADYTEAAINFGEAAVLIPSALSHCRRIGDDIALIEEWA